MHRRDVLRLLATGSILQLAPKHLLAVVSEARNLVQEQPSPRSLNAHQHSTVRAMADMIIPRTDTPGAAEVGAAEFIDLLLTEWYDGEEKGRFLSGLADVDSRSQSRFAKPFIECASAQQSEVLIALGKEMDEEARERIRPSGRRGVPPHKSFYPMFRQLILTAYYTSEAGATEELHFEMIPDHYLGCSDAAVKDSPEKP